MMLNNKGTNINHSGMWRSNASTSTSIRHVYLQLIAITYTRTRTRSCSTHMYALRVHTFKHRGSCANGQAPTYVPATKHSPWPQSIRHPLLCSLLLCYIIRSGVRERCSWHVVRLCGTGTRHGTSAQSRCRRRPRGNRLQRHRWSGQLLHQKFADHEDRGQKGDRFVLFN